MHNGWKFYEGVVAIHGMGFPLGPGERCGVFEQKGPVKTLTLEGLVGWREADRGELRPGDVFPVPTAGRFRAGRGEIR
jgi:hypothetical protein